MGQSETHLDAFKLNHFRTIFRFLDTYKQPDCDNLRVRGSAPPPPQTNTSDGTTCKIAFGSEKGKLMSLGFLNCRNLYLFYAK